MKKRFLIYGFTGTILETLWTGLGSLVSGNMTLVSHTSLWMVLIYGLMVFNEPLFALFKEKPLLLRGLTYTLIIFSVEYLSGRLLKTFNICPWDYSSSPRSLNGLILPAYGPLWFAAGLFYERLFFVLTSPKQKNDPAGSTLKSSLLILSGLQTTFYFKFYVFNFMLQALLQLSLRQPLPLFRLFRLFPRWFLP